MIAQVLKNAVRADEGRTVKRRRAPSFKASLPIDIVEFSPYLLTPQRRGITAYGFASIWRWISNYVRLLIATGA
jgi:hypothetical protein